jgi:phospholipid/cholesterol/gamma-HCH transport system substrate-binding protein
MSARGKKWLPWTAGVVVLAVVAGFVVADGGGDSRGLVSAYFTDADSLIPGNTVRANGVEVGQVEGVVLDHGRARVDMRLDPKVLPLHQDASAKIRPVSLLGERYISIDAGSPASPAMGAAQAIPLQRTSTSVGLDDVLNTLDTPTSTALGALLTTMGEGTQGNGANMAGAIKALAPAMTQTGQLADVLDQQNALLDKLIDQAAPVASAVAADDGHTVDQLVQAADRTLGTVTDQRKQLNDALVQLPQTLRDTRETLQQLSGVADSATPALQAAKPVTGNLTAISDELQAFTAAGGPALSSLQPILDHANELLDQAGPAVSDLRAGSGNLRGVAAGARPLGTTALDNLDNLLKFITGWALATAGYDAIGHFFRASVPIDSNTIKEIAPDLVPPELLGSLSPERSNPSTPQQQQQEQATAPAPLLPSPTGLLPPLPLQSNTPAPADPGSATGLTQQQEGLLQGLIFGGL